MDHLLDSRRRTPAARAMRAALRSVSRGRRMAAAAAGVVIKPDDARTGSFKRK